MILKIKQAVDFLLNGNLVAFPTETVYGLGADASNENAVNKIFAVKGRPKNHPLIVHLPDISALDFWADLSKMPPYVIDIFQTFSPGPITLILPRNPKNVGNFITGGQNSVGIRIPNHPLALELLKNFQQRKAHGGLAAPSANLFGRISPTSAKHVQSELGEKIAMILDGGDCQIGIESTILDCSNSQPQILRPGHISAEKINGVLQKYNLTLQNTNENIPRVSGSLPGHYAPKTPLKIIFSTQEISKNINQNQNQNKNIAIICFDDLPNNKNIKFFQKMPLDVNAYANLLYKTLRDADAAAVDEIYLQQIPADISWNAVADRIQRAVNGSGK